jgi:hypothetical protein
MLKATAKNLEAIQKAMVQHNGNCDFPILEIRLNPFEVERLGWNDFRGVPIVADEKIGTGRFYLVCEGQHGETPAPAIGQHVPLRDQVSA